MSDRRMPGITIKENGIIRSRAKGNQELAIMMAEAHGGINLGTPVCNACNGPLTHEDEFGHWCEKECGREAARTTDELEFSWGDHIYYGAENYPLFTFSDKAEFLELFMRGDGRFGSGKREGVIKCYKEDESKDMLSVYQFVEHKHRVAYYKDVMKEKGWHEYRACPVSVFQYGKIERRSVEMLDLMEYQEAHAIIEARLMKILAEDNIDFDKSKESPIMPRSLCVDYGMSKYFKEVM
jgi:hypothetical protein